MLVKKYCSGRSTALAIDKYSLDFCATQRYLQSAQNESDDKWSISPPESKEFEDSNHFFYELEEKKNSVKQGYVIDDVKRQYDDPKSVASPRNSAKNLKAIVKLKIMCMGHQMVMCGKMNILCILALKSQRLLLQSQRANHR